MTCCQSSLTRGPLDQSRDRRTDTWLSVRRTAEEEINQNWPSLPYLHISVDCWVFNISSCHEDPQWRRGLHIDAFVSVARPHWFSPEDPTRIGKSRDRSLNSVRGLRVRGGYRMPSGQGRGRSILGGQVLCRTLRVSSNGVRWRGRRRYHLVLQGSRHRAAGNGKEGAPVVRQGRRRLRPSRLPGMRHQRSAPPGVSRCPHLQPRFPACRVRSATSRTPRRIVAWTNDVVEGGLTITILDDPG